MAQQPMHGMPEVTVERDLPVTMADGVTLYADVYRPAAQGPHPVVLISHPYDKAGAESNFGAISTRRSTHATATSPSARTAVVATAPRALSTLSPTRRVTFCRRSTGAPGCRAATAGWRRYGFSYAGINQLLAAQEQPAALAAFAPAFTAGSPYSEWFYRQGAFSLAFAASWANFLALDMAARRKDDAALGAYAGALGNAQRPVLGAAAHRASRPRERRHALLPRLARSPDVRRVLAALRGRSFDDRRARSSRRRLVGRLRSRHRAQLPRAGPPQPGTAEARHRPLAPHALGPARRRHRRRRRLGRRRLAAALLGPRAQGRGDGRLRQRRHGLRHERRLARSRRLAALRRPAHRLVPALCRPSPDAPTATALLSTSSPADEPPDVFVYDPALPGGERRRATPAAWTRSTRWDLPTRIRSSARSSCSSIRASRSSAISTSPATCIVTLHAATDAPDTDFTARLCVVDAAGISTNLLEGIVRARYRESVERPTPITAGRDLRVPDRARADRPFASPRGTGCDSRSAAPTSPSSTGTSTPAAPSAQESATAGPLGNPGRAAQRCPPEPDHAARAPVVTRGT